MTDLRFRNAENSRDGDFVIAASGDISRNRDFLSGKPFRVDPSGINTDNFKRNPVLLWMHDDEDLPIGKAKVFLDIKGRLVAKPIFHDKTERSKIIHELWDEGFINASSVRLSIDSSGVSEFDEMINIGSSELVELSLVTVPGDGGAHRVQEKLDNMKNKYDRELVFSIAKHFVPEAKMTEEEKEMIAEEEQILSESVQEQQDDELLFELDETAVTQLRQGVGVEAIEQRLAQLELAYHSAMNRIEQLEGEPVIKQNISSPRFSFNSQGNEVPKNIQLPTDLPKQPRKRAASRQILRMANKSRK